MGRLMSNRLRRLEAKVGPDMSEPLFLQFVAADGTCRIDTARLDGTELQWQRRAAETEAEFEARVTAELPRPARNCANLVVFGAEEESGA